MNEIKWITSYLMRYKLMFFFTICGSIVEIMLFSSPSLILGTIIDLFIVQSAFRDIFHWILILLALVTSQALVFYIVATVNEFHAHRVTTDMTADLFQSLQDRSMMYHNQTSVGDMMARATGDTRTINIGISPAIRILTQIVTLLIFSFFVLLAINWRLTLVLAISYPVYAYLVYMYGKKLGPESIELRRLFGELSITANETFRGINEIKSYTAEQITHEKYARVSKEHAQHVLKFGKLSAFYPPSLLISVTLGITAVYGMYLIILGQLSFGDFVIFVGMVSTVQFMSRNIRRISTMAVRMIAAAARLQEMMNDDFPPLSFGTTKLDRITSAITFENVAFRYSEDREWALQNINLILEKNKTYAIVGGPGSGKSTFIKLLLRLYDPQQGKISIDGISYPELSKESLRQNIGSIEQDIYLFSDTIRNNIAFGKPQASLAEVQLAARYAQAEEFIETLENGYDTIIGERGITLSGGQKQRLAIARALLLNPAVLLMDDASSALDAETEFQIQSAIQNLLTTRTSIIITHRLSIISEVDSVIVFHKGKMVALGTHHDLLRTSSYYRRLFESMYELPPLEVQK